MSTDQRAHELAQEQHVKAWAALCQIAAAVEGSDYGSLLTTARIRKILAEVGLYSENAPLPPSRVTCVYGKCTGAHIEWTVWSDAEAWMDEHMAAAPHSTEWPNTFRIDYPGDTHGVAYRAADLIEAPSDTAKTCSWCTSPAPGTALHNDGLRHPSCGQPDHGQQYAADLMLALRRSVQAARSDSRGSSCLSL